jgi:glucosamine 6-phosphate synthetase-like amidotransferase/phosphosugar isomerase protein
MPRLDEFVSELLAGIEERGTDATGYAAMNDAGDIQIQKASCSAYYFNRNRARIADDARTVLLHTRWATQGKPAFPENNHPVQCGEIIAVHNGHIFNDSQVFRTTGKIRRGQVDSEAIPAIVAARGWDRALDGLEELDGGLAAALISTRRPGSLILAKGNDYPLVYVKTDDVLVWASTFHAIEQAWHRVLGTPPKIRRYSWLAEGEAVIVRDRNELRTARWNPPFVIRKTSANYSSPSSTTTPLALPRKTSEPRVIPEAELDAWLEEIDEARYVDRDGFSVKDAWVQCDDCGEWWDSFDIEHVRMMDGSDSWSCPTCASFARQYGLAVEA